MTATEQDFLTAGRVKMLTRLLYVALALAALTALLALPGLIGDFQKYAVTLLVTAALVGGVTFAALQAIRRRSAAARRLCITTGIVLVIGSVPLVAVVIGLVTAVLGVGVLVVTVAPEKETP